MDMSSLERIESFPYRHRVNEVMASPLVTAGEATPLGEACRIMAERGISSLVICDSKDRPIGIVTERDVLRAVAANGGEAVTASLSQVMSGPVATVREDALVYVALGRMDRLHLRHLVAIDPQGRATGMVTARALLRLRASSALALGDQINTATEPAQMLAVNQQMPRLAKSLLEEGVDAAGVAQVTSSVLRDMTARAAELAEAEMTQEHWGPPPARYSVLLLGSGGRRESLFGADQDNAIVHDGGTADDPWFAEAGRRIADRLDAAGIPYCQGGVMAKNREWRHDTRGWHEEIDRWVREAEGPELLNVYIFLDFRPTHGERALGEELKRYLVDRAGGSKRFLQMMAESVSVMNPPLGILGQFLTKDGRLNIKTGGLMPIVSSVRLLAVKHKLLETGTTERLRALQQAGHIPAAEAENLNAAHHLFLDVLLRQQIEDAEAGREISNWVSIKPLDRQTRHDLKEGFKSIKSLHWVMQNALSSL